MKKGNLLIIDDDPGIIYLIVKELKDQVDQIFEAKSGEEALEVFSKQDIHCAICDIIMPGMNGVDVIRKIREMGNLCPIVFYTGYGTEDLMFEVSKYGAFDFVHKPDINTLKEIALRGLEFGVNEDSGKKISDVLSEENLSGYWKLIRDGKK